MKRFLTFFSVLMLGTSLFAAINNPAATVNLTKTVVISTDELNAKVKEYQDSYTAAGQDPTQVSALQILNTMINDELFRQGAARDKVTVGEASIDQAYNQVKSQSGATDEQFKQLVESNFGTVDAYRSMLKDQLLVQQYLMLKESDKINAPISVTDTEIQSLYRKTKSQLVLPENVKISHIYIPFDKDSTVDAKNKATMTSVAAQVKKGTLTFEQAVIQYSQDEDSKDKAGDIGWLTMDNTDAASGLGEDFIDVAFSTPVGTTSDLVVSNQGYHIIKILAHNDAKLLGLNDKTGPDTTQTVRDYLKAQLEYQKQQANYQAAVNDLLDGLRKQATIKILYK